MSKLEEIRFDIIKRMLEEFPELREKIEKWLQENSTVYVRKESFEFHSLFTRIDYDFTDRTIKLIKIEI